MLASELSADHLRRHAKAARRIRVAIRPYFVAQTAWLLSTIDPNEPLVPDNIGMGYDPVTAHAGLLDVLYPVLIEIAEEEADRVMALYSQPIVLGSKIFKPIADFVKGVVDRVLSADWWHGVAKGVVDAAKKIIGKTIEKSGPIPVEDVPKIKAKLGTKLRKLTKFRVDGIAASEANGAINLGTQAAGEALEVTTAEVEKKTWVTVRDERVRATHVALHMKSVPVTENFNVGGYPAPHPGYWELPIQERINCRCFLAMSGVEDDLEFPLPPELRLTTAGNPPESWPVVSQ